MYNWALVLQVSLAAAELTMWVPRWSEIEEMWHELYRCALHVSSLSIWDLVQETADNTAFDAGPPGKDVLLEEACSKYEAAIASCPSLHEVHFVEMIDEFGGKFLSG